MARGSRVSSVGLLLLLLLGACLMQLFTSQIPLASAFSNDEDNDGHAEENEAFDNHTKSGRVASPRVWLVSFIAILIISLVGLAGVAVVPLVQSRYYNHLIQYLVAVAVGSLTGDAMLHLLPHAIVRSAMEDAHAKEYHDEKQTVLRGLVALGGVYFFFMAEKFVAMVTEYRSEKHALLEEERKEQEEGIANRMSTLDRQKRRASRLYAGKSTEDILTTGLSSKALRSIDNFRSFLDYTDSEDDEDEEAAAKTAKAENKGEGETKTEDAARQTEDAARQTEDAGADEGPVVRRSQHRSHHLSPDDSQPPVRRFLANRRRSADAAARRQSADGEMVRRRRRSEDVKLGEIRLIVPSGGGGGGGHHQHEMPRSLVSVAWMVILGDGLHNFTDGLAIGAAFAQSVTGGISTSIAVFCHELPHELGDFAVLLKTGMSVKQALFYNVLSSILAAVGMVIGICISNVTNASYWIFAVTAGIFIYIALVDMLPELNLVNVKPGESRIAHFALQNAGIMTGVSIMFLIAIFEDEIRGMFGDSSH